MNTVDALNKLGAALLGDSYESKVGLTDAETIESIADQVKEAGGLNPGGGGEDVTLPFYTIKVDVDREVGSGVTKYEVVSHSWEELCAMMVTGMGTPRRGTPIIIDSYYQLEQDVVHEYRGFYYPADVTEDMETEEITKIVAGYGATFYKGAFGSAGEYDIVGSAAAFEPPSTEGGNPLVLYYGGSTPSKLTVT